MAQLEGATAAYDPSRTLALRLASSMVKFWKPLVLGCFVVLATWSHSTAASPPSARDRWSLKCVIGKDEFASNCEAVRRTAGWRVEISTGDSQLFLTVKAAACPVEEELESWWRDEMTALSATRRAAKLNQALERMSQTLRQKCPSAPSKGPNLQGAPDIAVHGDP